MSTLRGRPDDVREARRMVATVPRWYHTIEVAPGVLTPGWFDLRPILDELPWPEVRGRRCLDVGTSDGFLAFELERRGAAEVLAVDIHAHEDWDWEPRNREPGLRYLEHVEGPRAGSGFAVAHELLGSSVRFERRSIYELDPQALGTFDVVVCGSLLLHLRDPLRGMSALRAVCAGELLLTNQVDLLRSLTRRRQPLFRLDGSTGITQWWLPNAAGNRQLLRAADFDVVAESKLYAIPYGTAHPTPARDLRGLAKTLARRLLTGHDGVLHHAVLGRPAAHA